MSAQRNSFVANGLAGLRGAICDRRRCARAGLAAGQAPAMFESLEERQMMSVSMPGTGSPADAGGAVDSIVVARPALKGLTDGLIWQ